MEEEFIQQTRRKIINFNFDKISVKKYLGSYSDFLRIKNVINSNRFNKYYISLNRIKKILHKEPKEILEIKKKLNIQMYSNEAFFNKFNMDIYDFLGKLNSAKDEATYNQIAAIIKRTDTPTKGRKIKNSTKNILKLL